jgi:hypothetical protein
VKMLEMRGLLNKPGTGTRKGQWSEEEDTFVLKVIAVSPVQPFTQWKDLAALLPGRSGKQIRDRWINYLNPSINHLPFSQEDDLKLWHGHRELGKRWAEIGEKIFNSTRSENHIKNRWYSAAFKKYIASEFGDSAYINASSSVKALSKIKMTADEEEEGDYGALIYRESQLRKAEAAAAVVAMKDAESERREKAKRKREAPSEEEEVPRNRAPRKQCRKTCSADECTNQAVKGGVCIKHGAKLKRCSSEGCTNQAVKGGVCIKHGAERKRCSTEGCTNNAKKGGVCMKHGAKVKRCCNEGCTNQAVKGGLCWRHGAKKKRCIIDEGCTKELSKG